MIVKRGQPPEELGLSPFVRHDRTVLAKRMKEDFMIETDSGWSQGRRGDWLVLIEGDAWSVLAHTQFERIYRPFDPLKDCIGPCDRFGPQKQEPSA